MLGRKNLKNFKSLRNTKRDTTSTSNNNPGLPWKNWDYQRNKQRLARNQDYQKKSGISKTKIETARFSPTTLAEKYEGYHSKK